MTRARIAVNKVQVARLLAKLKTLLERDSRSRERESILATLEILADRPLTDRLMALSQQIDQDVAAGRLLTTADVFGK